MSEVPRSVTFPNGPQKVSIEVVFPDHCPLCGLGLAPEWITGGVVASDRMQLVFRCPRNECHQFFIATYNQHYGGEWRLAHCQPRREAGRAFTQEIADLSPSFVTIYKEAIAAESHGFESLVGIGLRKALEFLLKDFCISRDPAKSAAFKAKFLGNLIKEDVSDPKLKACAERAVWLGNDETHYERRWVGKDVSDLKLLIELTLHWVQSELLTAKFEKEMPKPAGKS